jgi:hypothetical protein
MGFFYYTKQLVYTEILITFEDFLRRLYLNLFCNILYNSNIFTLFLMNYNKISKPVCLLVNTKQTTT